MKALIIENRETIVGKFFYYPVEGAGIKIEEIIKQSTMK